MRLNKYIAKAGIASRRKADELIKAGLVTINGEKFTRPGYIVSEGDEVKVNGKRIVAGTEYIYIILNKPKGYITSAKDQFDRLTVMDLVEELGVRLFPIGRLDYNTKGLLLMTNDGDFAQSLSHPKYMVEKTYRVLVSGQLSDKKLATLHKGVDIGGYITAPAKVKLIKQMEKSTLVEITITEGKNRQVRKMFAVLGNRVRELERIAVGDLRLGHLKEGHYRKLTKEEIEKLRTV